MFKAIRKKLLVGVMKTDLYAWALLKVVPKVRFSTGVNKVEGWQYRALWDLMEPSDFLLAIDNNNLAGKMITRLTNGQVSHAAQCVAKGDYWETSEMTQNGYTQSTLFDVCKHADRVILATCADWDATYKKAIVQKNLSFIGAKYDTRFQLGVEFLACSELIYHSDFEHRLVVDLKDVAGIGQPYISPEGLRQAKNLVIKADTATMVKPALTPAVA